MVRSLSAALSLLCILITLTEARDILVGGKAQSWNIPSPDPKSLNNWAESARFRIGDTLVWKYDGEKDSVLQVTKEAYENCIISNPLKEYKDGNTKVTLDRSGPFYFISGAAGHCQKGQKLIVVVMSPKHRFSLAPSPAEFQFEGPAVAPTSAASGFHASLLKVVALVLCGLGVFLA